MLDIPAAKEDLAGTGPRQRCQQSQQRRFAGAVRAVKKRRLSTTDAQRDFLERGKVAEKLGNVADFQRRFSDVIPGRHRAWISRKGPLSEWQRPSPSIPGVPSSI